MSTVPQIRYITTTFNSLRSIASLSSPPTSLCWMALRTHFQDAGDLQFPSRHQDVYVRVSYSVTSSFLPANPALPALAC
ncbi:MAG: hypothetical protein OXI33_03890 [Chloroflexota bacterium]|nr:hypothetical protein [Chloroflexota bacterium]